MTKKEAMDLGFTHYGHTSWHLPVYLTLPDAVGEPTVAAKPGWWPEWALELALDLEQSVQIACFAVNDFFGWEPKGFLMTYVGRLDGEPLEDLPESERHVE